jgi:hypothetical protein
MSTRIASIAAPAASSRSISCPSALDRARAHGVDIVDLTQHDGDLPDLVREMTGGAWPGRGHRRGRHGGPRRAIGKLAHRIGGMLPDALSRPMTEKMGSPQAYDAFQKKEHNTFKVLLRP